MLEDSRRRVVEQTDDDALVLDVGGGALPFPCADWVLDLLPTSVAACWAGTVDPAAVRFGPRQWVKRDVCARDPWPFQDHQFDFVVCSHLLEGVRDPVWVCSEPSRVARAGYVEVPSRLVELTWGIQGPWVGWGHHHWLVDSSPRGLEFVFKHHVVHRPGSHLPLGFIGTLDDEHRVQLLWWEDTLPAHERILVEAHELDGYLEGLVGPELAARGRPAGRLSRTVGALRRRTRSEERAG